MSYFEESREESEKNWSYGFPSCETGLDFKQLSAVQVFGIALRQIMSGEVELKRISRFG